ncbi:hypothetical protein FORMA_18480 [Formosa sp. Hel3_A1_48]|nr:hypothetical protein FORMA_18480 [Formosa sp. Hel3_A1_48]
MGGMPIVIFTSFVVNPLMGESSSIDDEFSSIFPISFALIRNVFRAVSGCALHNCNPIKTKI